MNLTELHPAWVNYGGAGVRNADGERIPLRRGVGVSFDCPCGCGDRCSVFFDNPIEGDRVNVSGDTWHRTGESFDVLTLSPSIQRVENPSGCKWHGFVENGRIRHA